MKGAASPQPRSDESRALEAHWHAIRGNALVPPREAFDPLDVPRLLPRLFLFQLEPGQPAHVFVRVYGTGLVERTGADITGCDFLDFVQDHERKSAGEAMQLCARWPCGRRRTHRTTYERGYAVLSEVTYFPMTSDDAERSYLLGISVLIGSEPAEDRIDAPIRIGPIGRTTYFTEYIDVGAGVPDDGASPPRRAGG